MSDWDLLIYESDKRSKTKKKKQWALNCEKLQKENPKW